MSAKPIIITKLAFLSVRLLFVAFTRKNNDIIQSLTTIHQNEKQLWKIGSVSSRRDNLKGSLFLRGKHKTQLPQHWKNTGEQRSHLLFSASRICDLFCWLRSLVNHFLYWKGNNFLFTLVSSKHRAPHNSTRRALMDWLIEWLSEMLISRVLRSTQKTAVARGVGFIFAYFTCIHLWHGTPSVSNPRQTDLTATGAF